MGTFFPARKLFAFFHRKIICSLTLHHLKNSEKAQPTRYVSGDQEGESKSLGEREDDFDNRKQSINERKALYQRPRLAKKTDTNRSFRIPSFTFILGRTCIKVSYISHREFQKTIHETFERIKSYNIADKRTTGRSNMVQVARNMLNDRIYTETSEKVTI